jgi:hypothetical protein
MCKLKLLFKNINNINLCCLFVYHATYQGDDSPALPRGQTGSEAVMPGDSNKQQRFMLLMFLNNNFNLHIR